MTVDLGDPPATYLDLQARGWSGTTSVGALRIAEAWRALNAELPGVAARMAAGTLSRALVSDVIVSAALRVLDNPDGHTEESAAVDDYTESATLADASSDLYFTAAELRRLSGGQAPTAGSFKYS